VEHANLELVRNLRRRRFPLHRCRWDSTASLFTNPGGAITITNTHRTGEVSGATNVGAFIEFAAGQDVWITNSSMDGEVTGTGSFVGGFIGRSYGVDAMLSITNSSVTRLVEGTDNVGGFVGSADGVPGSLTITDSSMTASVSGDYNIGGLVGNAMTVEFQDSSVDATVEGTINVGGLVGIAQTMEMVTNSESRGSLPSDGECDVDYETMKGGLIGITPSATIDGSSSQMNIEGCEFLGGLAGYAENLTVVGSYTSGEIHSEGNNFYYGGLVGSAVNVDIEDSYSTGMLYGEGSMAGGLIGQEINIDVTRSFSTRDVDMSGGWIGGLIGWQFNLVGHAAITDSYSTGIAEGLANYVGGFIGRADGPVEVLNSYTSSDIAGSAALGGFVGAPISSAAANESFCFEGGAYCGTGSDSAYGYEPLPSAGVPLSADNLKSRSYLAGQGWDFSTVWCIRGPLNDGFPVLRAIDFGPGDTNNCRPRRSGATKQEATLNPAGGLCGNHSSTWAQSFRGTLTLPTATDCQRDGHVFLGWTRDPSRTAPEDLVTSSISRSATLTAVWGALPAAPSRVDVLANFLCPRNCTSAIVVWPASTTATDTTTITIDSNEATCNNSGEAFGLKWCWITGLTPKTTHTTTVTWRNQYGDGPTTTATFTLN